MWMSLIILSSHLATAYHDSPMLQNLRASSTVESSRHLAGCSEACKAGASVGSVIGVVLVVAIILYYTKYKKQKSDGGHQRKGPSGNGTPYTGASKASTNAPMQTRAKPPYERADAVQFSKTERNLEKAFAAVASPQ